MKQLAQQLNEALLGGKKLKHVGAQKFLNYRPFSALDKGDVYWLYNITQD